MGYAVAPSYKAVKGYKSIPTFNIGASYVHPIAKAYFDRVKALSGNDVVDKNVVNQFIVGLADLKVLGLIRETWLLNSLQNAGSGTILYGIKGSYDLTLMNGPVWENTGITFTHNENQFAINNSIPLGNPTTLIHIWKFNALPVINTNDFMFASSIGSAYQRTSADIEFYLGGVSSCGISSDNTLGIFKYLLAMAQLPPDTTYLRTQTNTGSGLSGTDSSGQIGFRINGHDSFGRTTDQTCSISMLINGDVLNQAIDILNLCKQTVGQGLGL